MNPPNDVRFNPEHQLFIWQPQGVLDTDRLSKIIAFIEYEEQETAVPFNRFTDLSLLFGIDLDLDYVVKVSMHRRKAYAGHALAKSAFYTKASYSTYLAKVHSLLNDYTRLEVAVFSKLPDAAEWLGVPQKLLLP